MSAYFGERYYKAKRSGDYDPLAERYIYKKVTEGICIAKSEITKLVGEDIAMNTFDKQLP